MSKHDLTGYCGSFVEDNGELSNLYDVIDELTEFLEQFNSNAMSEHQLYLQGKEAAYQDVIDYLARVAPIVSEPEQPQELNMYDLEGRN